MVQSLSKSIPDSGRFYRVQGNVPSWITPTTENLMFMFNDKPISTTAKLPTESSVSNPILIKILAKTTTVDDDDSQVESLLSRFWSFSVTVEFVKYRLFRFNVVNGSEINFTNSKN